MAEWARSAWIVWARRGVLCLLLGAASTWLVAWVCALPIPRGQRRASHGGVADDERLVRLMEVRAFGLRLRTWLIDDLTRDTIHSKSARREAERVRVHGGAAAMATAIQGGRDIASSLGRSVPDVPPADNGDDAARRGPPWSIRADEIADAGLMVNEFAHGWPWLALRSRCDIATIEKGTQPNGLPDFESVKELSRAVELHWPWASEASRAKGSGEVMLPLEPIWSGFAANTLVYSALWYGMLFAPGMVRRWRRAKRGRCCACGYDLRGVLVSGCPECGWGRAPSADAAEANNRR